MIDSAETIGLDLEEARARIEAVREKLRRALEGQEGDQEAAWLLGRLERLSADVARVKSVVAGVAGEAMARANQSSDSLQTSDVTLVAHHAD